MTKKENLGNPSISLNKKEGTQKEMSPTHTTYEKEDFDDERFLLYLLTKERAVR